MKAKFINERFDKANDKAIAGWMHMYHGNPNFQKTIQITEPTEITFDKEQDYNSFIYILQKYRIPFKEMDPIAESLLKFNDGIEIDTSGPLRPHKEYDGWYVVGNGLLIPVNSEEEALEYIKTHK